MQLNKKQKYKNKASNKITNLTKNKLQSLQVKKNTANIKRVLWYFQGTLTQNKQKQSLLH